MGGTPHLLRFDQAYETTPRVGLDGLRFPLERYLPPDNCINIDDEIKMHAAFEKMARKSSNLGSCFRCGKGSNQHPRGPCGCQWCGGNVDGGHPDRECPWIYATAYTWREKLSLWDPSTRRVRSGIVPVNVQIKPTKAEQSILANIDSRFRDFPYAREGHDLKIPDGVCMRRPWRPLPPLDPQSGPSRPRKRPRNEDAESAQLDRPTPQPEDLSSKCEALQSQIFVLVREMEDIKRTLQQHLSRCPAGYSAGPNNDGRSSVHGNPAYSGFDRGCNRHHGSVMASEYAPSQPGSSGADGNLSSVNHIPAGAVNDSPSGAWSTSGGVGRTAYCTSTSAYDGPSGADCTPDSVGEAPFGPDGILFRPALTVEADRIARDSPAGEYTDRDIDELIDDGRSFWRERVP
ncbi:hypothetical protein yc1106_04306 [Curvularia clavata]|uniref:Uncharacterized protein n=1 Tax=Curvularia clavata TaxID=95742 RepID=A0A9Q9DRV0_CURCL|nr:hypothetical protein yc1106_04306 [Curvularia clavata]